MAGGIFLNYRRGDDPGNTGRLYDRLEPEFPGQLFMDVEGHIKGGLTEDAVRRHVETGAQRRARDRRPVCVRWGMALVLAAGVGLAALDPATAQMVREHDTTSVRGFHTPDGRPATRIRRSFQSDGEARAVLREVLAAAGLQGLEDRIILRATADTSAAEAFIEKDERLIAYNAVFMQSLRQKTNDYWSLVAVLAHEVGHHVRFHTVIAGRNHEFELEADYQAGFILRRMGATLEQAQAAFKQFPEIATATHPGRVDRVQAVTLGWVDGGERRSGGPLAEKGIWGTEAKRKPTVPESNSSGTPNFTVQSR